MMTSPVGGIDPHQDTITVGVVNPNGVELAHAMFPTTSAGYPILSARCPHTVSLRSASMGQRAGVRTLR